MDMREIVTRHPLLAILRRVPTELTLDYAGAVIAGGVSFFEVALNSPDALRQISLLRREFGGRCLVGAGTAVTPELCRAALDAGAQFLLTPGTPTDVLAYCAENDVMLLPGALTPTDVAVCGAYGFKTLKLFPAGDMPRAYVRSLKGPFDDTEYVAIGGVSPANIREFFDAGCIGVGLASSLMPAEAVKNGDWEAGSAYIRELVARIRGGTAG